MSGTEIKALNELDEGRYYAIVETTELPGQFRLRTFDIARPAEYRAALQTLAQQRGTDRVAGFTLINAGGTVTAVPAALAAPEMGAAAASGR